jgi:hypothetical protein
MVLYGCVDLSIILSSPHSGRPIRYALQVFAALMCFALLTIQPPPAHFMVLYGRVDLSIIIHSGRPIRYALQVFADLKGFALLDLHPAAA